MGIDYDKIPVDDLIRLKSGAYDSMSLDTLQYLKSGGGDYKQTVGNPNASPAETERMRRQFVSAEGTLPTRIKEFTRSAFDPRQATPAADSVADWAGRVVPESITKLAPRMAMGAYDVIKGQTDPLVSGMANTDPNAAPAWRQMEQNAGQSVMGLAQGMAAPVGLMGTAKMKDAWLTDPAMSALAAYPAIKMDAMGAKAILEMPGISPQAIARSALKPYNGEMLARNKAIDKAMDTAVYDPNASFRPRKFIENNLKEMEQIVGRQNVLMDEKGVVRANIEPIKQELESFVSEARKTPGTSEGAVKAADTVLQDILNHPDYRPDGTMGIEALQQTKKNIWNYLKDKGAFNKDSNPAMADAMWTAADGMVKIVNDVIPEMASENARYGELANVNKVLTRSANRIDSNNLISLPVAMQLINGEWGAVGRAIAIKTIDSPYFKLFLAQKMGRVKGRPATKSEINNVVEEIQAQYDFNPEVLPNKQAGETLTIPGAPETTAIDWNNYIRGTQPTVNTETLPGRQSSAMDVLRSGIDGGLETGSVPSARFNQPTVQSLETLPGRQSSQMDTIPRESIGNLEDFNVLPEFWQRKRLPETPEVQKQITGRQPLTLADLILLMKHRNGR